MCRSFREFFALIKIWKNAFPQTVLCLPKRKQSCFSALHCSEVSHTVSSMFARSVACTVCACYACAGVSPIYYVQVADKICEQHEGPHQSKLCCFFILVRCIVLLLVSCTLYHLCTTKCYTEAKSPHTTYFQSNVDHVCNIKSVQRNILCIKSIISYNTYRRDLLEIFP